MGVTIRRNFGPLQRTVLLAREDWEAMGRLARERIVRRTVQGLDAEGRPFAPYSEGYAKARAREGHATAPVTLQLSGEMIRNIEIIAHDDRVELTW